MMQAVLVWLLVLKKKNLGLEVLKRSGCIRTYVVMYIQIELLILVGAASREIV